MKGAAPAIDVASKPLVRARPVATRLIGGIISLVAARWKISIHRIGLLRLHHIRYGDPALAPLAVREAAPIFLRPDSGPFFC